MKTRVTVESLSAELDEAIALAKATQQPAAITQAVTVKGKLHGLLIDRKETGQPGDFAQAQSAQEVIDKVRAEMGDEAARALAVLAGLASPDVGQAKPELSPEPAPPDQPIN